MSKIIEGPRSTAAEISAGTKNILQAALDGNLEEYSPEDLIRARAEAELQLNPLRVGKQGAPTKYVNAFIGNLNRDYQQALAITSVVAYLHRMMEEHFVKDAALYEDAGAAKANVAQFLGHFFEFNPDLHVSEMRKRNPDPAKEKAFAQHCKEVRECADSYDECARTAAAQLKELEELRASFVAELDSGKPADKQKMESIQRLEISVALATKTLEKAKRSKEVRGAYDTKVPYDFFYWFSAYFRSNYDALRTATDALWPVRSDMDEVIIIYDAHNNEEEAKAARYKLASDQVPINTFPMGLPVFHGPTKENVTKTEFTGQGHEVFRQMLEHHKREAVEGERLLSHIAKVRSKREGIAPADPAEVKEFSNFCAGLRAAQSNRELTDSEKVILEEEQQPVPDREAQRQAVHDVREERDKAEIVDIMEQAPEGSLATQLVGTNPDTGELNVNTVYIDSEETRAEKRALRVNDPVTLVQMGDGDSAAEFPTGNSGSA
jgi:hypothetical protein